MTNRISILPQDVVDKIAAGEVIVRPVNAVKELIENCLDAGATEITVSISKGGLDLIKIQDNGNGIEKDDMSIVCERFATSKLREYEDLTRMRTFGFRGEALASISYVSKVSIISRTENSKCAFKAIYQDGKMISSLTSSAGTKGTVITAQNLFYNCVSRRHALKYPNDEAHRIVDLLVKYAIHNPHVSFALRRLDNSSSDFRTSGNGDQKSVICALLGDRIGKELLNVEYNDKNDLHFCFRAFFSTPIASHTSTAIQSKKERYKYFFLFINERNVESPRLKQSIDLIFASKDVTCQFIIISLKIDPARIDVNVHPTKAVVHFLNEDKIIEAIEQEIYATVNKYCDTGIIKILNSQCTTSISNTLLKNNSEKNDGNLQLQKNKNLLNETNQKRLHSTNDGVTHNKTILNNSKNLIDAVSTNVALKVRIDSKNKTLDEFVSSSKENAALNATNTHLISLETSQTIPLNNVDSDLPIELLNSMSRCFDFDSLNNLRSKICTEFDKDLTNVFHNHYFVGFYDNLFGIFQVDSSAYIIQLNEIVEEFFYQQIIFSFGNMGSYQLKVKDTTILQQDLVNENLLDVKEILELYFEINEITNYDEILKNLINTIVTLADLLWDYFSIKILVIENTKKEVEKISEKKVFLKSLPCIINGFVPPLDNLPNFLYNLSNVDFSEEETCFEQIAKALANFFASILSDFNYVDNADFNENLEFVRTLLKRYVFPLLKSKFLPPKHLWKNVCKITSIEQAFKKFGRC